jgi:hypothetical protein
VGVMSILQATMVDQGQEAAVWRRNFGQTDTAYPNRIAHLDHPLYGFIDRPGSTL